LAREIPKDAGRINQAVLWHLRLCRRLLDLLRYHRAAAHVSAAIDALVDSAKSDAEISELDLSREEHVEKVLEMFRKHRKLDEPGDDSKL
jgi:KaiC/GvpD/RAD55 family RecA-like ATPase